MATTTDCLGSSPSPTKPTTPNHRSPSYTQTQRGVQNDTCFHCRNRGHWAANCPFRSPLQSQSLSQSQYLSQSQSLSQSPNSDTSIPCPYGHGSCFVKISQSRANPGRPYYSCYVCKFFKWQEELDLESGGGGGSNSNSNSKARRDRAQDSYPDCLCGAGKCEIVQERTGKYFVCPIQKGLGG